MESSKEFELALQEAELLKLMPCSGALARQFLLLVEENKALKKELEKYSGYAESEVEQADYNSKLNSRYLQSQYCCGDPLCRICNE